MQKEPEERLRITDLTMEGSERSVFPSSLGREQAVPWRVNPRWNPAEVACAGRIYYSFSLSPSTPVRKPWPLLPVLSHITTLFSVLCYGAWDSGAFLLLALGVLSPQGTPAQEDPLSLTIASAPEPQLSSLLRSFREKTVPTSQSRCGEVRSSPVLSTGPHTKSVLGCCLPLRIQ